MSVAPQHAVAVSDSQFLEEPLSRRTLIANAMLAVLGTAPVAKWTAARADSLLRDWLPTAYPAAQTLGRLYLQSSPEETRRTLMAALFGESSWDGVKSKPADELIQRLRAACARDFEAGNLVLLDGWLLARSEARFLALTAIAAVP